MRWSLVNGLEKLLDRVGTTLRLAYDLDPSSLVHQGHADSCPATYLFIIGIGTPSRDAQLAGFFLGEVAKEDA